MILLASYLLCKEVLNCVIFFAMDVTSIVFGITLFGQLAIDYSNCELFTALVHMEGLLHLEEELLSSLNSYITTEKER